MPFRKALREILKHYELQTDGKNNRFREAFNAIMRKAGLISDINFISDVEFIDCIKRALTDIDSELENTITCLRYKVARKKKQAEEMKLKTQQPYVSQPDIYAPAPPVPRPTEPKNKQPSPPPPRRR